ncbi:MAG: hypothetical protein K0Q49_32 [Haloplasmataceae bacterium]|jgi:hypothetical protein|nr:hypothetical protein [Haloplasmataceae bacterium]
MLCIQRLNIGAETYYTKFNLFYEKCLEFIEKHEALDYFNELKSKHKNIMNRFVTDLTLIKNLKEI